MPRPAALLRPASAHPLYELRVRSHGPDDTEYELWEMPSRATPHLAAPRRVAGLRGRNMALIEHRVLRRLRQASTVLAPVGPDRPAIRQLEEDAALTLGLMFRVLAPMRSADRMRACAEGIEAMGREEAAYWLGMAMHRRNPRRVLTALRYLLTDPSR
jgi:hypothetical protein